MSIIVYDGIRWYKDKNGYYARMQHLHRYVWEKYNGNIPKGYHIHHKDENRMNNNIENLQLLTNAQHSSLHTKGKQYGLGSRRTPESKEKIRKALTGNKNGRANKGKHPSLETRIKIGEAGKGRPAWNKGKKSSQKTIEKLRKINLGKRLSQITKNRIGQKMKGRILTPEWKEKIGITNSIKMKKYWKLKKLNASQKSKIHS